MVHLTIAKRIIDRLPSIKNKDAFYLGSLAPDTPGFMGRDKTDSHFCVGDEGWGHHTNFDEWQENAILKINEYKGQVDKDFIWGYLSHIITDIENGRHIWTPIRLAHSETARELYCNDSYEIDSILLCKLTNISEIWAALQNSNLHCLPELFTYDEVAVLIDKTVNHLYKNRYPNPNYIFAVNNFQRYEEFIENTVDKIMGVLP